MFSNPEKLGKKILAILEINLQDDLFDTIMLNFHNHISAIYQGCTMNLCYLLSNVHDG
jgi:hypothetical protein